MNNEDIVNELGLANASAEVKERIVENVRTIVELRVIGILSELMTDEQEATFSTLQEQGDSQAMWNWLRTEVVGVDVSEVYEATLRDYLESRKSGAAI